MRLALLYPLVFVAGFAYGQDAGSPCAIAFRVVEIDGKAAPYVIQSFTDGKTEFAQRFVALAASVPCGDYRYVLHRTDIKTGEGALTGSVNVRHPESWVSLSAPANVAVIRGQVLAIDGGSPGVKLRGWVNPEPGNKQLWIRLSSVFGQDQIDVKVRRDGRFWVYDSLNGPYVLVVTDEKGIVYVHPLPVKPTGETLSIDLSPVGDGKKQ